MINKYYESISFNKCVKLLQIDSSHFEEEICEMIVDQKIKAKINRLKQTVEFNIQDGSCRKLDNWISSVNDTIGLVDFVAERIEREIKCK